MALVGWARISSLRAMSLIMLRLITGEMTELSLSWKEQQVNGSFELAMSMKFLNHHFIITSNSKPPFEVPNLTNPGFRAQYYQS
jgi:hypothetical protein